MPRLRQHTLETAPEGSRRRVEAVIARNGYLPNLIAVLAGSAPALEAYLTVSEINTRAGLDAAEREIVQITAASLHGCEFCVSGHSALALKQAGLDVATVVALQQRGPLGHPRHDALVAFTRAVIASRGNVGDGELRAFLDTGFSEAQALEVLLGVSLATLCNFANNLARVPINPQLAAFRPGVLEP